MNPIQVNCPGCQKRFLVRPDDLTTGLVRFQCTGCQSFFGFNWPQPPGTDVIRTNALDANGFKPSVPPKAEATVNTAQQAVTKTCFNCQAKVDAKAAECPQCGVIFEKVKKIRPPDPVVNPAGPEVVAAWDAVKLNYSDLKRHDAFVQLCLSRENLAYASSQYRSVLLANPSDDIANRMQNKIIELATAAYVAAAAVRDKKRPGQSRFSSTFVAIGVLMIAAGFVFSQARSLIAVGVSIMVFVGILKYLNKFRE